MGKLLFLIVLGVGLWVGARTVPEWGARTDWLGIVKPAAPQRARVIRWIDGDTLLVDAGLGAERVRLLGIDAPERQQDERAGRQAVALGVPLSMVSELGREAWAAAQTLAGPGTQIFLQGDRVTIDAYGRRLAYVFNSAGQMVNLELVVQGAAWTTGDAAGLRYGVLLAGREAAARARAAGVWRQSLKSSSRLGPRAPAVPRRERGQQAQ